MAALSAFSPKSSRKPSRNSAFESEPCASGSSNGGRSALREFERRTMGFVRA